jgi:hypothetical protein
VLVGQAYAGCGYPRARPESFRHRGNPHGYKYAHRGNGLRQVFCLEFLRLAMGWKNVNPVIEGQLYLGK